LSALPSALWRRVTLTATLGRRVYGQWPLDPDALLDPGPLRGAALAHTPAAAAFAPLSLSPAFPPVNFPVQPMDFLLELLTFLLKVGSGKPTPHTPLAARWGRGHHLLVLCRLCGLLLPLLEQLLHFGQLLRHRLSLGCHLLSLDYRCVPG